MKIKSDIRPISYIKSNTSNVLNQVNETHRPIFITQNGEPRAVLLDTESYESMNNAIGILKLIALGEKDIRQGKIKEQPDFFSSVESKYFQNKK
ncbi:MAG: type II toxin-antitoxin system Phd/YefM family antitoxin [Spirochaetae bacterium HGW-Spirochaetae-1]|nr:MAG: type II toxin-antitoxin system Phd/YefM family antitoxin [Spirochaetae bacterium HGW-Spirochaetae-1]